MPSEQRELLDAALDDLAAASDLINEALEAAIVAGEIRLGRYGLPGVGDHDRLPL